jgi:hypothetical protein
MPLALQTLIAELRPPVGKPRQHFRDVDGWLSRPYAVEIRSHSDHGCVGEA